MHYILTYFGNSKRDGSGSPHNRMQQTELQASNQAVTSIVASPSTRRQSERKKKEQDKLGSLSDVKEDPSGVSTEGDAEGIFLLILAACDIFRYFIIVI